MKTTTTLQDLIIASKCRKGKSHAITAKGAYWLALPPVKIRRYGGDGIGQSYADRANSLELRHYRDGNVEAVVVAESWHQNYGHHVEEIHTPATTCTTAEEVVVALKNLTISDLESCSDYFQQDLIDALVSISLPEYEIPSPDDEPPATPE